MRPLTSLRRHAASMGRRHGACALAAALTLALLASAASAYEIDERAVRWPYDTIKYSIQYVDRQPHGNEVERAFSAWNRSRSGWSFIAAPSAEADVVVLVNRTPKIQTCLARTSRGYYFSQASIGIRGRCGDRRRLILAAAHEIGHVLGLEEEERRCAVMNPGFIGAGARTRPSRCRTGPKYWLSPIRSDDRRGGRALHARPFGFPLSPRSGLCDPPDEMPTLAQDFLCKYQFDCRGLAGPNVGPGTTVEEGILRRCPRTLRIRAVPKPDHVPTPSRSRTPTVRYAGRTSQGRGVSFTVSRGLIRGLRVSVRFTCGDGTRTFARLDPLDLQRRSDRLNEEDLGSFPSIPIRGARFRRAFESPSQSAIYELSGTLEGGAWRGSVRVIEGWSLSGFTELVRYADPDGEVVCDTGSISFTAARQ